MFEEYRRRRDALSRAKISRGLLFDNISKMKHAKHERLNSARIDAISENIIGYAGKSARAYREAGKLKEADEMDAIRKKFLGESGGLYRIVKTGLERAVRPIAVVSILCLLGALFFVSFNLTGASIGSLTDNQFSLIGTGLFFLGLVFAFLFLRGKNKN